MLGDPGGDRVPSMEFLSDGGDCIWLVTSSKTFVCVDSRRNASPTDVYMSTSIFSASSCSRARRFRAKMLLLSCWDNCLPPRVLVETILSASSSVLLGRYLRIKVFISFMAASLKPAIAGAVWPHLARPLRLASKSLRSSSLASM